MLLPYIKLLKIKRGLELVSLPYSIHDSWRKIFLTLYFFKWPISLPDCLYFLRHWVKMCIVIICCPVCDVINFEINHSFLIKLFFYINKKSAQKCKYFKNQKSFKHEIKSVFNDFKGLSIVRNCLRPESRPLNGLFWTNHDTLMLTQFWKVGCNYNKFDIESMITDIF